MRQTLSVGDVAARVDIAVPTLRNWDRRYGVGPSIRTPGGHRRYTLDDLALIERMHVLVSSGMSAGRAAALARKLLGANLGVSEGTLSPAEPLIDGIYESALSLDADRLRRDVDDLLHNRLAVEAWDDVLLPVCRRLRGETTDEDLGKVAAHLLESLALSILRARAHRSRPPGRPRVVLVGIGTEETKLPLAALDAALCEAGVVTTVLGSVLGAREIEAYLNRVNPAVVCQWAVKGDVAAHRYCDRSGRTVVRGGPGWSAETGSCETVSAAMDRIVGHPEVHAR